MMNMLFVVAQQTSRHRLDWADVIHYSEEGYHVHDLNSSTDTQDAAELDTKSRSTEVESNKSEGLPHQT